MFDAARVHFQVYFADQAAPAERRHKPCIKIFDKEGHVLLKEFVPFTPPAAASHLVRSPLTDEEAAMLASLLEKIADAWDGCPQYVPPPETPSEG